MRTRVVSVGGKDYVVRPLGVLSLPAICRLEDVVGRLQRKESVTDAEWSDVVETVCACVDGLTRDAMDDGWSVRDLFVIVAAMLMVVGQEADRETAPFATTATSS